MWQGQRKCHIPQGVVVILILWLNRSKSACFTYTFIVCYDAILPPVLEIYLLLNLLFGMAEIFVPSLC